MGAKDHPYKTFKIAGNEDNGSVNIKITELPGVKAENLGLKTWGAAFILANQVSRLHQHIGNNKQLENDERSPPPHDPPNVLEIGAGTGLAGLAAALLWKAHVTLTDLPTIVPGMAANILINEDQITQTSSCVQCGTLDWATPDRLHGSDPKPFDYLPEQHKFRVILAADTLYGEDHPGLMADVIFRWLAPGPDACFIVCYAQRVAYLDHIRELWSLLESGGLRSVEEGIEMGDASWDEEAPFEWAVFKWADSVSQ